MAKKPPRRTRAAFRSLNLMLVSALVAQLVLVAGILNAAPAFAGGGSFTPGGYTFGFDDFADLEGLKLNGVAATIQQPVDVSGHPSLRVLRSVMNEHSSVFWDTPIQIADAAGASSFSQKFEFRISNNVNTGADGIVFMIGPSPDIVGGFGGGIGYAGIDHSVGVEFDTWQNGENADPNNNHVGIDLNGNLRSVATGVPSRSLESGQVWTGWVDYDGATHRLEVRASDDGNRPDAALAAATVDIPAVVGGDLGYFGLTSASGAASQTIDVLSWNGTGTFPTVQPVVAAGADQTVPERSTVQLTGTTSGPVESVKWTQVSGTGPHVSLLGASTLTPSFRAPDDGTYVFRLTGTAGTGTKAQSVSDDVQVTVTNVDPVVGVEAAPTVDDGTVMVSASVTDPGILDIHTATVEWGDGSTTKKAAASTQGAGWAVVNAAHVYQAAGTYPVRVTVADDDGGTATTSTQVVVGGAGVPVTQVPIPCALCALGTGNGQGSATIDMNGQANWTIKGGVYDNGTFKIQSPSKLTVTPSGAISVVKGSISCTNFQDSSCPPKHTANAAPLADPLAGLVLPDASTLGTAKQWPCTSSTCTVQPGVYKGPFNINSGSVTTLKPGTYVFTRDLLGLGGTFQLDPNAAADQGVTLYFTQGSSLEIRDQGALKLRAPSTGALAGVAVAYDRSNSKTLAWRGSRNSLTGTVYAPAAQLRFDTDTAWTSSSRFIAGTVSSQNSTLTIDPSGGLNAGSSQGTGSQPPVAASPIVVPALKVTTDQPKAVSPGADARITTTVTNHRAHIAVPVLVAVTNKGSSAATIDTVAATAQIQGGNGTWSPLATGAGESIVLTGVGTPVGSTSYPEAGSGDGITGTSIPAGGSGVWAGTALIEISAASLNNLLDTSKVSDLRVSLSAAASGASTVLVQRLPAELLKAIRTSSGTITGPSVTMASAQGNKSVDLADLAAGDQHDESFTLAAGAAPKRSDYDSDATYLATLALLDASKLIGLASAQGTAQVGTVYAAADPASTRVDVPVLTLSADPVPATRPGEAGHWRLTLANTGSATATGVHLAVDGNGATVTVTGVATTLAAGASAKVDVALKVPTDRTTTLHPSATLTWTDSDTAGNAYGPISADGIQRVVLPADLTATMQGTVDGSTVHYELAVVNSGDEPVTGITAGIPIDNGADDGARVVADSVRTSQGQITNTGPTITVQLGDLAAHATALVDYTVDYSQLTPGQTSVTTQAQVTAANVATVWSDDPLVAGEADPTVVTFTSPPGGGTASTGGTVSAGTAQIAGLTPSDGTAITQPTAVTVGAVTPPANSTIASWKLSAYPTGTDPERGRTVASGTGDPSGQTLGSFDPTVLGNGQHQLRLTVTDSTGATSWTETALVVDGAMKLGRYTATLTDMTLGVAGVSVQLQRSYDSFDKTVGDFGVGWSLAMADFTVSTNGPLGRGGWNATSCGGGMVFATLCFTTSQPHFVTITWPDGHNEVFNLTPAHGSTFMPGLTSAQFTGRPGTTSTLTAVDGGLFFDNGDLDGGAFGGDGVYNPTRFVLTDKAGTRYDLTVGVGLTKITARTGETITITPKAITSSTGPAIIIARDAEDRVTKITGPDGHTVSYDYTADGDLGTVTNQLGNTTSYHYAADHYLDKVTGPDASILARYEYDASGRLVALVDGNGNRTQIASDPGAKTQAVTSADGKLTTVTSYNAEGLTASVNKVYDGANHITSYGYDGQGNTTSRTDPEGNTWQGSYSGSNLTSLVEPGGRTTTITYNDLSLPVTWKDAAGNTTTYQWNSDGTLASRTDANGNTETYSYDGHGWRTSSTDANGNTTHWTYTDTGLVASKTDPLGNKTRYEYDGTGRQTATIDPNGNRSTTSYDATGQVTASTDADGIAQNHVYDALAEPVKEIQASGATIDRTYDHAGNVIQIDNHVDLPTSYGYDSAGRQTSTTQGSHQTSTSYDGAGNIAASTDELGNTTRYSYTADGNLASQTNPAGGVTSYTYTPTGQVATRTDPNGGKTTYSYDALDQLIKLTAPNGGVTSYTYDAVGHITRTVSPDGGVTKQDYDAVGNLVARTDPLGNTTRYGYDKANHQISTTDPTSRKTTIRYDPAGQVVTTTAPDGGQIQTSYSPGGRELTTTTPSGIVTTNHHNSAGLVDRVTDPLGNTTSTGYDSLGRTTTQTSPRQQGSTPSSRTTYNDYGQIQKITDNAGNTVSFGYDAAGNRTSITDPLGKTWTVAYDTLGDPTTETDPLGRSQTYTYDNAGQLTAHTDPRGIRADYAYDNAGQLTGITQHDGAGRIGYSYDTSGRRTGMTDSTGATSWIYRADGTTSSITTPEGAVSYTYDDAGRRTSMTQPQGTIHYTYDDAGRLASVSDWNGATSNLAFNADGQLTKLTRPNQVTSRWSFDQAGRLVGVKHEKGSSVLASYAYSLDADGNRASVATPDGTESYRYDQLDQLTGVTYSDGSTASYSYDPAGNRTSQTAAGTTTHYSYDDASQLVGIDGVTVTHDQAGNVTGIGSTSYDWDWLGRMVKITSPDGTASYSYDGDNLRIQATGDTAATGNLLYDRQTDAAAPQLIADANGAYTWTPAGQLSQQTATTTSYTLADALGSTRALTNSSGTVTATVDYDVYGNVRNQTGTWGPYGYTAGIQTGSLVTLGERDLRTDIGQFLSTDPERPGGNGVTGWNQYTYVTNNPTTYIDPTGREAMVSYANFASQAAVTLVGATLITGELLWGWDALQRCLANTSCVLHPPTVTQPTSGAGNPAAANPPSIQDISNSLMTWATAALSETAARAAAQACEKTLSGLNLGTDPCTQSSDVRIFFEGGDIMGHTIHAAAAIAGHPAWAELNRIIPPHDREWYQNLPVCKNKPSGTACDEYPFASTEQGGPFANPPVSLLPLPAGESTTQGGKLIGFYNSCGVAQGAGFYVVPVPVEGVPTFGYCRK